TASRSAFTGGIEMCARQEVGVWSSKRMLEKEERWSQGKCSQSRTFSQIRSSEAWIVRRYVATGVKDCALITVLQLSSSRRPDRASRQYIEFRSHSYLGG